MIAHLKDIPCQLLAQAPTWLSCGPESAAYIDALGTMLQALEDSAESLRLGMDIETCCGKALDQWGRLVDMPRGSMDDEVYRRFIKAKGIAINSSGTAQDLSDVLRTALPFLTELDVVEDLPLGVTVSVITTEAPDAEMLARVTGLVDSTLAASVRFSGTWGVVPVFAPDDNLDPSVYGPLGLGLLAFDF